MVLDDETDLPGLEGLDSSPPAEAIEGNGGRVYHSTSLGWRVSDEPRKTCIRLLEWSGFEPIILTTIVLNCATLAWDSPVDPPGTPKAAFLGVCELAFLFIFSSEMLIKVTAYGFVWYEDAYLRDPWCQLDFAVVSVAWLPLLFPNVGNYSVVRAVRALRPLRALKRIAGMPVLINSLLAAMPKLGDVAMLVGLLVVIFGIAGTEEFKGTLHYRCARTGFNETPGHPSLLAEYSDYSRIADGRRRLRTAGPAAGVNEFDTATYCDPHAMVDVCSARGDGSRCAYFDENLHHGVTSFDNFGWTTVIILQAITFDAWTISMYGLEAVLSSPFAAIFFYLPIVFIGGFFLVQLFLAVLFQQFVEIQELEKAVEEEQKRTAEVRALGAKMFARQKVQARNRAFGEFRQLCERYKGIR